MYDQEERTLVKLVDALGRLITDTVNQHDKTDPGIADAVEILAQAQEQLGALTGIDWGSGDYVGPHEKFLIGEEPQDGWPS